jgi:hypothetical protein
MNDEKRELKDATTTLVQDLLKRPYVKPRILSDAVFERAAGCGKSGSQGPCVILPKSGS